MSQAMKRFLQFVAAVAICASLLPTAADAAQKKKVEPRRIHRVYGMTKHSSVMRAAVTPAVYEKNGDPALKSAIALVMDQDTHEVLLAKNDSTVQPIASITKLMTGLLISEAKLPMDEMITITQDDVDTEKHSSSRLRVGTTLSRGELLNLALMSSENRAAHALGRTYPGGLDKFVELMNAKAQMLGMKDTHYVEPTGLSSHNQSSAQDLATLVKTAYDDPLLREYTTMPGKVVAIGKRNMEFHNTNRLVKNPDWDIGLQKTGYINEAGRCLVMQAKVAGRKLIMVFLDSAGRLSRIADAERVRHWLERQASAPSGSTVIRQVNG
jgi:D-alanyl-D-alanine endopeptidase (penicillin-binding protein 7)